MKLDIIGNAGVPLPPQKFLRDFVSFMEKELKKKKILQAHSHKKLVIAFVSSKVIRRLNQQFLKRDKVTDVLSFSPLEHGSFGEIALCMEQIKVQAKAHKLTVREETAYLILHGFLHLLGYQHESGGPQAKKMYQLQDEVFEQWQKSNKKTSA